MKSIIPYLGVAFALLLAGCSVFKPVSKNSTITYNRTGCYGTCPIYELTIDGKGNAVFVGERFTDKLGTWEKSLNKNTYQNLFKSFEEVRWGDLDAEYPAYVSDVPSTVFQYKNKKLEKQVIVTGEHPVELDELSALLNAIVASEGWTNISKD